MLIQALKLDSELRAANVPIEGCAADGRIDFTPEATDADKARAAAILAAHDPSPTRADLFRKAGTSERDAALVLLVGALIHGREPPAWALEVFDELAAKVSAAEAEIHK